MAEVCARGYIIISKDKDLLAKWNSLMIWKRAKGRIIQLASGTADRHQLIQALLAALRKMERVIETVEPPFVMRVLLGGRVEMIRPENLKLPFLEED